MTQEEKAKAYDEAVERAKEAASNGYVSQNFVSDIFPELKESEGERIRKKLVQFFKEKDEEDFEEWVPKAKVLAWIEEQGEHANFRNKIQIGDKVTRNEDGVLVNLSQLNRVAKKQGEEKPVDKVETNLLTVERAKEISPFMRSGFENESADKVEPKFHKGDWVVYCNDDVDLITGIEENGYCINNSGYIPFVCASDVRLWTIEDAKDGDVLVSESTCVLGTWYCIFKSLDSDESMTVYCYLARDGRFETKKELCFDKDPYNTNPATKEQRDLLFQKMKEAGYEWDAEKKELKKINEEVNDEDYGIDGLYHAQRILEKTLGKVDGYQSDDGILEHKCAISAVKELSKQKQELLTKEKALKNSPFVEQKLAGWSEEDKDYYDAIIAKLEVTQDDALLTDNQMEFLKSLKERVQPQNIVYYNPYKEVVESIAEMCKHYDKASHSGLRDFYDDVKVKCKDAKEYESLYPQNTWKPSEKQKEALLWCVVHLGGADKQTLGELLEELNKL